MYIYIHIDRERETCTHTHTCVHVRNLSWARVEVQIFPEDASLQHTTSKETDEFSFVRA